ncbi:matrixin family metalloprotease [Arthrobacter pityocampae]|uniref:matrixin family metalloprotease n=1 Tax=Arthrobacter pityocampae TaxID=547334 RepID=UPI0037356B67
MAGLNLGELSGIISLDERPAMTALNRVRRDMRDTANEGQRSTDRMTTQQARYAAAVETASSNVTRARQRERDAADAVRVSEIRLADARRRGADDSAAVVAAQARVAAAHGRVRAAQDDTARSGRDLQVAQSRLADSMESDSQRVSTSFGKMGQSGNRAGRNAMKGLALITVGLTGIMPAAGAASSALIAAAGSALTLGSSLKDVLGVAALAPAALFTVGTGAGVLVSAFQGMGEALKTATEETGAAAGNAKLDAMALEDAARGIAQAERAAADQRAAAAKTVSDAQENAARTQQDAAERVASAEKKAADDRAAAARRLADAQQDLTEVVERNADQHAAALRRVTDAEKDVERAQRSVRDAQLDLTQARADAVRQIDDLNDALKGSGLAERDAALRYEDALAAFNKGIKAGAPENSRAMRGLKLDLDQAAFGLEEAKEEAERLRLEQAKGVKDGVKGNKQVVDAEQALKDARQAATDAVSARADAVAEVAKVERENARRVVEAQEAIADATREAAEVQIESAANIAEAVEDGAEAQADAAEAVAEAVADAAKSQIDSAESVADAHRNLERVQIQQADAAAKATEKSVAAMEKLTPAAQVAVVALLDVYRRLGQVQDAIQEEFFTGFADPLRELADVVIPQLFASSGTTIAGALGRGMQQIMRSLASGLDYGVLFGMLRNVADTFEILNGAIDPTIQALITLTDVGMDYMPRMGAAIRDAALEFDAFIQQAASDGSLRGWIDDGIQGTKDLFSILGSTLGILDKLEDAARAGGIATTLSSVADGLDRIEAQVSGPVFQETMSTIFAGAKGGADGLLAALGPIGEAFRTGGPALAEFLRLGGEIAGTFVGSMFTGLSDPNFGAGLTSFLGDVQDGVEKLGPKLPGLFSALGDVLESVGPVVEAFGPTAVDVLTIFADGLAKILDELEPLLTDLAESPVAVGIFMGVIAGAAVLGAMATFATSVTGITTALKLMWLAATGPVGWVIAGVGAAAVFMNWFYKDTEAGQNLVKDAGDAAAEGWNVNSNLFVTLFARRISKFSTSLADSFRTMVESSGSSMEELGGYGSKLEETLAGVFRGIESGLGLQPGLFDAARIGIKAAWDLLPEDVKAPIRNVVDNVINNGLIKAFNTIPGVEIPPLNSPPGLRASSTPAARPAVPKGQKGPTRYFAKGGYAAPGWAVVGEEGPELVNFSEPGRVYTAKRSAQMLAGAAAQVDGCAHGAATIGEGNMGGFFEGNAANIRRHGAYFLDVAAGMGPWNFKGAADLWDGAAGVKVKTGRGNLQGHATPLERGGGILGYTTGNNIDMSPSWMGRLGATQRRTVAAHEMGHAMGLPHNSKSSIMQPNLGQMAATPTPLDIRNLQTLFPGGTGKAGNGEAAENPLVGLLGGLMTTLKNQYPEKGMFMDASAGLLTQGYTQAFSFIEDIKKGIGNIAGDVVNSIRDFFGGGAATMTPTLMDGGGWLRDTDGPQIVDHRRKKPDAFTPFDEWQQVVAHAGQTAPEVRVYIGNEQIDARIEVVANRTISKAGAAARYTRVGS